MIRKPMICTSHWILHSVQVEEMGDNWIFGWLHVSSCRLFVQCLYIFMMMSASKILQNAKVG